MCCALQTDIIANVAVSIPGSEALHALCLQQMALLEKTKALLLQQSTFENILNDSYLLRAKPIELAAMKRGIQVYANVDSIVTTREENVVGDQVGATFQVDDGLAYHIISNLVDNANKYGDKSMPLSIELALDSRMESTSDDGECIFDFSRDNEDAATQGSPTKALHIHISNGKGSNHEELQHCNASQLQRLFVKGEKGSFQNTTASAESSGHGSWIMMKCLAILKGKLLMAVRESSVCMQIVVPVDANTEADVAIDLDVNIAVLEDSALQRKIVKRMLAKAFPGAGDSKLTIHGATMAEIEAFPAFVMGHDPPFTTIIIDQHLGQDGNHRMVKGTDTVEALRQSGCKAVIFIQSASGNKLDVEEYLNAGANGYLAKDSSPEVIRRAVTHETYQVAASCS